MKSPLRSLDRTIQEQYTRIGQEIPYKYLYPITFGLQMSGKVSAGAMCVMLNGWSPFPGFYGFFSWLLY